MAAPPPLSNPGLDGDGVIDSLRGRQCAPQVLMSGGGDLAGRVGDPATLTRLVLLQAHTTTTPQGCADKGMSGTNSNASLPAGALAHALTCPNVAWGAAQSVSVSFTDVYSNTFGAPYWVPAWRP